ncbi:XdhC family protein [soil metagenome]
MKEIQNIINKAATLSHGEKAILATVVSVAGSGYRRPGARMLIGENGYSIGTVSGGCLEADVLERAKKVLHTGEPTVIIYDTTADENSVFGLSMGCRGIVRILLEPFEISSGFYKTLVDTFTNRIAKCLGTIVSATNEEKIGGRIFYNQKGEFKFENVPETISDSVELKSDIEKFYERGEVSEIRNYKFGEIGYEIFFENIAPPLNILLFGAGYDALPLMKFAKEIGWQTTAIDHRPAFANAERLTDADKIIVSNSEDLSERIFQDENSVAVIMTHNYERDRNILRLLLNSKCRYVGALGPKKRTEKLLAEIGENFSDEQLSKLHAPIGLDIGADSPEAIALAIVAEIQSVLKNRAGGFLRERQGSIYERD